ncbi:conserved exported protein of unknown function [Candidatus Filomicrobium marinum]|uniref:Uncharacterized protein n=2 Tax=Candidatus Filomicrobium marinum TaxID=1608628 RepID=A0A0D6JGS6_9HYPH|nr:MULTISPECIES: tetratricopeptide repeat protein [Filomicrobium]MCV0369960.1 tetratricopeptide repeat protein [Filomicrobium sp.]CFX29272.1 conserved exported protein of unknown function [Candidatus Filomicrobium marinum]CPR19799.1 conserved exported protein of unknown function [Candidatus Filomicrobium marinum]
MAQAYRGGMHIKTSTFFAVILLAFSGVTASAQELAQDQPKAEKPYFKQVREGLPKTPADRAKVLANLYAHLAAAPDAQSASMITETIEQVWSLSYSDTIAVLMDRSVKAMAEKNSGLALKLLDAVVDLAPDYAEGWNRRAIVYYANNDYMRALGDLRRVLALDPNHYKALDGLAQILRELDRDKQALQAYRQIMSINPYWPGASDAVKELEREVEGQGI